MSECVGVGVCEGCESISVWILREVCTCKVNKIGGKFKLSKRVV